jgi:hypothetical protein
MPSLCENGPFALRLQECKVDIAAPAQNLQRGIPLAPPGAAAPTMRKPAFTYL